MGKFPFENEFLGGGGADELKTRGFTVNGEFF